MKPFFLSQMKTYARADVLHKMAIVKSDANICAAKKHDATLTTQTMHALKMIG